MTFGLKKLDIILGVLQNMFRFLNHLGMRHKCDRQTDRGSDGQTF